MASAKGHRGGVKARLGKFKEPVFITGAAGFIGRRLLHRLLDEGVQVVGFDVVACPEALEDQPGLSWFQGDIASVQAVRQACEGCKTIFHLAAMVGDWGKAEQHRRITVEGTQHVFEAALAQKTPPVVVLASSIVVYGDHIAQGVCDEAVAHGANFGPYSVSKQAQEKLALNYIQRGLDIRIVRPANVYGAGSKPWVEELCQELKKGTPCLVGGGDFDAGLVHVENVVEVMHRAARASGLNGQIFNAADENGVTWKRYLKDMAQICGAPPPKSIPYLVAKAMAIGLERSYRLLRIETRPPMTLEALNLIGSEHHIDMSKTRAVLGYKPRISYQEGLAEVRDYLAP
jgi:nucleoside-diphosphate-sugar epimerase